jgi:hypothetical protein
MLVRRSLAEGSVAQFDPGSAKKETLDFYQDLGPIKAVDVVEITKRRSGIFKKFEDSLRSSPHRAALVS